MENKIEELAKAYADRAGLSKQEKELVEATYINACKEILSQEKGIDLYDVEQIFNDKFGFEDPTGITPKIWDFFVPYLKRIKGYETALEEKDKLNSFLLNYSENQRKIIVLLLEGINEVKVHLPFSTNLKLTEIINVSEPFTKPLPAPPIQKP